jgi:hypothetical protein
MVFSLQVGEVHLQLNKSPNMLLFRWIMWQFFNLTWGLMNPTSLRTHIHSLNQALLLHWIEHFRESLKWFVRLDIQGVDELLYFVNQLIVFDKEKLFRFLEGSSFITLLHGNIL